MHSSSGIKYQKKNVFSLGGVGEMHERGEKQDMYLHSLIINYSIMNQSTMNLSNLTVTKVTIKNHSMTLIILLAIFILEWIDMSERFDLSGTNIT